MFACRSVALPGIVTLTSLWFGKSKTTAMKETGDDKVMMDDLGEQFESDLDDVEAAGSERSFSEPLNEQDNSEEMPTTQPSRDKQEEQVIDTGVIVQPSRTVIPGKTAHYAYFDLDRTPSLQLFQSYLTSLDGGERSPTIARQYASNLSKFLCFASKGTNVRWMSIINAELIKSYLDKLTRDGVGISGQIEKLASIRHGIDFCLLEGRMEQSLKADLVTMNGRLKNWMTVMRKTKTGEQMRREEELSENPPDITAVSTVMSDAVARIFEGLVNPAASGKKLSISDEDTLVAYLLTVLMYGNAQRPAAVLNATMEDFSKRRTISDEMESYILLKVGVLSLLRAIKINQLYTTGDQTQNFQDTRSS